MKRFQSTFISHEGLKEVMTNLRESFEDIESKINYSIADSRQKSIALTKLEEASMWINKAIAHDQQIMNDPSLIKDYKND